MHDEPRNASSVNPDPNATGESDRRAFLTRASSVAMVGGLVASYGTAGAMAVRYLFPARPRELAWMYVARAAEIAARGSLVYRAPTGEKIAVACQGDGKEAADFIALSSTCPHLGCQVHWEGQNSRFFCPCHNGTFDPTGRATGGPPGEAGQSLPRYALKLENGLVYIEVPIEKLAGGDERTAGVIEPDDCPRGPGHDPCLEPDARGERA